MLYDYPAWKKIRDVSTFPTLQAAWIGNSEYIVGDEQYIKKETLAGDAIILCLSMVEQYGYAEGTEKLIMAKNSSGWYSTDGKRPWSSSNEVTLRPISVTSSQYRVYLERQGAGCLYENLPMVRNIQDVGTTSLLLKNGARYEPLPRESAPQKLSTTPFNNGSRTRSRQVALTFDLMDDIEGLPEVLQLLDQYAFRATFFLNGEFIRRHPQAAKEIAARGHEVASLFFSTMDMTDIRFKVDADFVTRGLARNEDEFYNATGYELSLFWHAPYYVISPEIITAATNAGYITVGKDVDPLDWVSKTDQIRRFLPYQSASEMIEYIMNTKKPGSIIPIRLGRNPGGRDEYLFQRLDVLLNALVQSGYEVATVSTLIEESK
jgi:peptidoglycan/xylan/chitin deacetylase (PgdA/CDA1 family)